MSDRKGRCCYYIFKIFRRFFRNHEFFIKTINSTTIKYMENK